MKRLHKAIIQNVFLSFCLLALFWGNSIYSYAAEDGIKIILRDAENSEQGIEGVNFRIFQVGTVDKNMENPEFYKIYGIDNYPQSAEETETAVRALQEMVKEKPIQTGTTDKYGLLEFLEIDAGIYFVSADVDNSYGEIMPFLVHFPNEEMQDGIIEVLPKAESYGEEPEKVEPTAVNKGKQGTTAGSNTSKSVKTGDLAMIGLYLSLALSCLFVILGIRMKRRGGEHNENRKKA